MTEGIIQKMIDKKKRDANNTSFSDYVRISLLFNELEQELIAEIKKESKPVLLPENTGMSVIDLHKLIGDNQE